MECVTKIKTAKTWNNNWQEVFSYHSLVTNKAFTVSKARKSAPVAGTVRRSVGARPLYSARTPRRQTDAIIRDSIHVQYSSIHKSILKYM